MNSLQGRIESMQTENHLSLVNVKVDAHFFSAIVIDTPVTANYLEPGRQVNLLFKETEVVIAKSFMGGISMQNKFPGTVKSLEMGKLLCRVIVNYNNHDIVSLITTNAANQLELAAGDEVTAFVKTNEISLTAYD
jgi:molybdate transport system regulatory protein